jgi:tetratricopeptide (TPR) repeat protein
MNVGYHFVSHCSSSAEQFAAWLVMELERRSQDLRCWLAARDSSEENSPLEQVSEALRRCSSVIAIISDQADVGDPRVAAEWRLAISYKKPIAIVFATPGLVSPLLLDTRKSIDFSTGRDKALRTLADRLMRLSTQGGQLESAQEQLAAMQRAAAYASPSSKPRYDAEIEALQQQIGALAADAQRQQTVQGHLASAVELRRKAPEQSDAEPVASLRVVNTPPIPVPYYFENRHRETELIGDFLRSSASLLSVHGRGGVGKTALVCRVLRALENDVLPDDGGPFKIAGIVYINAMRPSSGLFPLVLSGLLATLDRPTQEAMRPALYNPRGTVATKFKTLMSYLPNQPTVVLLDNFEDVIALENERIRDIEIAEFLQALSEHPYHSLKIIITTRVVPVELTEVGPDRHVDILLREGLVSPYAEAVLKKLDFDGSTGFKNAKAKSLADVTHVTRGFPRALVAFYTVIKTDPGKEIEELTADLRRISLPAEKITLVLVGEAFSRLLPLDQKVIQAVAIYGRPVPAAAIAYVLADWAPYVDTAKVLKRLVAMQFVRLEARAYHLHPIDRDYALSCLSDDEKTYLRNLATRYFREISLPRAEWKTLKDIDPHLEQFRLRIEAGDDDTAASILDDVWEFLMNRGGFEQGLLLAQSLQKIATDEDSTRSALNHIATAQWRLGRIGEGVEAQRQLVDMYEAGDESGSSMEARFNLLIHLRELGTTEDLLRSSRELLTKIEQRFPWYTKDLAAGYSHLRNCLRDLGYLNQALEAQQRAVDLAERSSDADLREGQLHNLGSAFRDLGKTKQGEDLYRQALDLADRTGNPLWKANHLGALARCARDQGNLAEAGRLIAECLEIRTNIGDLGGIASTMESQAECLFRAGAFENGAALATKAYEHARDLKLPLRDYRRLLAEIYLAQGNPDEASRLLTEQEDMHPGARWDFDNLVGTVQLRRRRQQEGLEAFNRALAQCEDWLTRFSENPDASAGKALALAGLAACGQVTALTRATGAYRCAMDLNKDSGVVCELKRRLQQLVAGAKPALFDGLIAEVFMNCGILDVNTGMNVAQDQVFISYAHADVTVVQDLNKVLSPAIRNKKVEVWYDAKIKKGEKWRQEIERALNRTRVAVLVVTPNFLDSNFINEQELPFLINAAAERGVKLLWIYAAPCMVDETALSEFQCANDYNRPLLSLTPAERAQCLLDIAREIKSAYESGKK